MTEEWEEAEARRLEAKTALAEQHGDVSAPELPPRPTGILCPSCGQPLHVAVSTPDSAPWLCPRDVGCGRGFWSAELTEEARAVYRATHHDWRAQGGKVEKAIRDAVAKEQAEARERRVSVRPDQLHLLTTRLLEQALWLRPEPGFRAQLEARR